MDRKDLLKIYEEEKADCEGMYEPDENGSREGPMGDHRYDNISNVLNELTDEVREVMNGERETLDITDSLYRFIISLTAYDDVCYA